MQRVATFAMREILADLKASGNLTVTKNGQMDFDEWFELVVLSKYKQLKRNMPVNFRQLGKNDAPIYRKIRLECLRNFPDNFGSTFAEESQISELKFETFLKEDNADNFMFGAFDEKKLIGICGFSREPRNKTRHRGEIVQMYVNPDYSGKNIGFDLLQRTVEKALENSEIEQIILSVVAENAGANKLYEKLGFVEYGRLKNYFKDGEKYWNQRFMVLQRDK